MMSNREVSFWYWLVKKLPSKALYFAYMHVFAYATTGKYGDTVVSELTGMDAVKRFGNDFKI